METGRQGEARQGGEEVASRLTLHVSPPGTEAGRPQAEPPARLELHIGELVLQGFPGMDPELLGAAVRTELTRLLAGEGLPPGWGRAVAMDAVDGGEFIAEPGMDVQRLGARIARAVYGGVRELGGAGE